MMKLTAMGFGHECLMDGNDPNGSCCSVKHERCTKFDLDVENMEFLQYGVNGHTEKIMHLLIEEFEDIIDVGIVVRRRSSSELIQQDLKRTSVANSLMKDF